MEFEWDPAKNTECLFRHGFDFASATQIFNGSTVERTDRRRDYGEERIIAIGLAIGHHFTVIYTDRADPETSKIQRRIITAWRSNRRERKTYAETNPLL
jgi:hypothetical protein